MKVEPHLFDFRAALRGFAEALGRRRLLEATARLETAVFGPQALELLRSAEAAVATAWPVATPPVHELVWRRQGEAGAPSVALSAFDERGRLLLSRQFDPEHEGDGLRRAL